MKKTINTVVFLKKGDQVLLAMKKVRFGAGKWNGYGGKPDAGETIEETAVRELHEESGIKANKKDLFKNGVVLFHSPVFGDVETHIYILNKWVGEAVETEEMRPQWFAIGDIPYDAMWSADKLWVPKALNGEQFTGEIWFDAHDNYEKSNFS
jgi:8-oxo-dGTP pyrophosphatase MutT (NUDIX family)